MPTSLTTPGVAGLLKPLCQWLADPEVSEIMINGPQHVFVESRTCISQHQLPELTEMYLSRLCSLIANESQQVLSAKTPLLSATLYEGSRIQIVLPPIARNYCICIRKHIARQMCLQDYETSSGYSATRGFNLQTPNRNTLSHADKALLDSYQMGQWSQFIKQAIVFKKNIIIAGGTSSGKTTFLNACIAQITAEQRIITLEDTREISLQQPNNVQLLATKGTQGYTAITLQDLVQCTLRLRPDRIIIGEIRGREILDFISAASTGHEGVLTTIHANNPRIAFMRMVQLYKLNPVPAMTDVQIRAELQEIVDVIVQLNKTQQGRQITSIYYKYAHIAQQEQ